jgi:outer membrane protein assembly factor BamE (lipoprotein component of BamABCDE complex)
MKRESISTGFLSAASAAVLLLVSITVASAAQSVPTTMPVAAKSAPSPVYSEYKGVKLGMSADEVRRTLGKPTDKDDTMDFYQFSDEERARVYYGPDGQANAIVVTYIGKDSSAPSPENVVGAPIDAAADGSGSRMVRYAGEGYWVSYSRTAGDVPYVFITMKKMGA